MTQWHDEDESSESEFISNPDDVGELIDQLIETNTRVEIHFKDGRQATGTLSSGVRKDAFIETEEGGIDFYLEDVEVMRELT